MNTDEKKRKQCKEIAAVVTTFTQAVQYSYGQAAGSVHHDRRLQPANMEHTNFSIDFTEEGMTMQPITEEEADSRYNEATDGGTAGQFLHDMAPPGYGKKGRKVTKVTVTPDKKPASPQKPPYNPGDASDGGMPPWGGGQPSPPENPPPPKKPLKPPPNYKPGDDSDAGMPPVVVTHPSGEGQVKGEPLGEAFSEFALEAFSTVVGIGSDTINIVIDYGEEAERFVINTVEEAIEVTRVILDQAGIEAGKLAREFLATVFPWDEILQTQGYFINSFNRGLVEMESQVDQLKESISGYIESAQEGLSETIDNLKEKIDPSEQGEEDADRYQSSDAQTALDWLFSKIFDDDSNEAQSSTNNLNLSDSSTNQLSGILDQISEKLKENKMEEKLRTFSESFVELFTDSSSIESIIAKLLDIVKNLGNLLLGAAGTIIDLIFEAIVTALQEIRKILNAPLNIPFLSPFFKEVTKSEDKKEGQPLTMMNLVCLLVAVPFTIQYKFITGQSLRETDLGNPSVEQGIEVTSTYGVIYGICQFWDGGFNIISNSPGTTRFVDILCNLCSALVNLIAQMVSRPQPRTSIKNLSIRQKVLEHESLIWTFQFLDPLLTTILIKAQYTNSSASNHSVSADSAIDFLDAVDTTIYETIHYFLFAEMILIDKIYENNKDDKDDDDDKVLNGYEIGMYVVDPVMGITEMVNLVPFPNPDIKLGVNIARSAIPQATYGVLSILNSVTWEQ